MKSLFFACFCIGVLALAITLPISALAELSLWWNDDNRSYGIEFREGSIKLWLINSEARSYSSATTGLHVGGHYFAESIRMMGYESVMRRFFTRWCIAGVRWQIAGMVDMSQFPQMSWVAKSPVEGYEATLPLWLVLAAETILVACAVWLRPRHRQSDVCMFCGYDIHASRERCPECGNNL